MDGWMDGWSYEPYIWQLLMMYVLFRYAGPGSQKVTKRFNLGSNSNNWYEFVRSSAGGIQVAIDARGSAFRGDTYKFEINRR